MQILLVEDSGDFAGAFINSVKLHFPEKNVEFTHVHDLAMAQKAMEKGKFDAIITDNRFPYNHKTKPEENGIALIQLVRSGSWNSDAKNIPILFQTSDLSHTMKQQVIAAGATACRSKLDLVNNVGSFLNTVGQNITPSAIVRR